ncbi:hypothetical protein GGF49_004932 [Coemansia sp. RSA 1853]|nr:hypothetical protein GGF49_004932 [Coemansia sp. RSA 1853]
MKLQQAKDVLEHWDNVAPSTKGCYSSRIAMWIHYCNTYCNGDDRVDEKRLADYVEWLVSSGAAERIRQGATHVQQVLRNQLQGVICYWRIQNRNNSNVRDPRLEPLFVEKWQHIAMRFPRPRHARRTEPIYGTQKMTTPPRGTMDTKPQIPSTVSHIGYMSDNSPPHMQAMGMRHAPLPLNGMPPRSIVPSSAISSSAGRHPQHADSAHAGYLQPGARQQYQHGPAYGPPPMGRRMAPDHPYANGNPGYPQNMQSRIQPPPTSLAPLASRPQTEHSGRPAHLASIQSLAPQHDPSKSTARPISQQQMTVNESSDAQNMPRPGSRQSLLSENGAQQVHVGHKSDNALYSRAASMGVSSQLDATLVSAPASPKPKAHIEPTRPGVVPEELPVWEGDAAPEGFLLNANEALALGIRLLGAKESVKTQVHAHTMLGLAAWIPAAARSALTLADLSIDEAFNAESKADAENSAADTTDADTKQQPLKAIAIALRPTDKTAKNGKAVALRHANPFLCSWGTLALWLFSRWHVANEATPDFSTADWQSQRLFSGIAAEADFQPLVDSAISEISNDKIDGTLAMSDISFFFAEAFGLVKPTAAGIKGLGTVDAVNRQKLLPEVALAIARVNAGFSANSAEPAQTPKRFDVMPPPSLLKEVFPWLKTVLIDAFRQNTNNDDVQAARRILQVLRELRVVLLQDVAFLMEIPALSEVVKANPLFEHALFTSTEFSAFREEMRNVIGEAGIKSMDDMCIKALQWVDERKNEMPEGANDRMKPTAPILPSPVQTPALPSIEQMDLAGERKRQRELEGRASSSEPHKMLGSNDEAGLSPKRIRSDHGATTNGSSGRIFGDFANATTAVSPLTTPQIAAQSLPASGNAARALDDLRNENDDLKAQLRRLEWVLSQHKAEVRMWMGKVEKSVREISLSTRPSITPPTEQLRHHYPGAGASGHPGMNAPTATSQRSQLVSQMPAQSHEMSPQPQRYSDGLYRAPSAQGSVSTRLMGPPTVREGMVPYERPMHSHVDYRAADPTIPSPRNHNYGSQLPPGPEYADSRYANQYGGAPQYAPGNNYEHPERAWYPKSREPAYPTSQPPSMRGMHPQGPY